MIANYGDSTTVLESDNICHKSSFIKRPANIHTVARAACKLFPDAAIIPVFRKAAYNWKCHLNRGGIYGYFGNATGVAVAPIYGSLLRPLEYDDPALQAEFLATVPRLAVTHGWTRGDHGGWWIRLGYELPHLTIPTPDGKHERASLRSPGHYQVYAGSVHYRTGETEPSGDLYVGDENPVLTLTAEETAALERVFARFKPKVDLRPTTEAKATQSLSGDDFGLTCYALRLLDPDICRADWWKIGAALAFSFGERGIAEFERWSAGSLQGKYKPGEPTRTARSFKHGVSSPKTFKFVLALAYQVNRNWQKEYHAQNRNAWAESRRVRV